MQIDRMFGTFKNAMRGLDVQRQKIAVASENIANAQTSSGVNGAGSVKPKSIAISSPSQSVFGKHFQTSVGRLTTTNEKHVSGLGASDSRIGVSADHGPVVEIFTEDKMRAEYDPGHPHADSSGMVYYPDVDMIKEMSQIVMANRLYEANLSVIEAEKQIIKRALEI
ncbi:MAG: hypothetical protein EA364_09245 [Balneolaceae bacterium]|nr:MAG: hypothetical protein EA364_09245 [Balneolaceae bacterium]